VLFGSTARPIILAFGAAAVLALGGATIPLTAMASDSGTAEPTSGPSGDVSESPSPTPSDTPTSDPTTVPPVVDPPSDPPPTSPPPSSGGGPSNGGGGSTIPAPSRSNTTSPSKIAPIAAIAHLGSPGMRALPFTAPGTSLPGTAGVVPAIQPQLPLIGQPPAVAPKLGQPGTPTALRAASSPLGMDDTVFRLVLTQVAWLSALVVFMSVLLTQIRLRRRRLRQGR
jgi:hypothetical protein